MLTTPGTGVVLVDHTALERLLDSDLAGREKQQYTELQVVQTTVLSNAKAGTVTHQQFYEQVGEILATEVPLTGSETLIDLGWDSLAAVVFMAMADERCGVKVAPRDMRGCSTVNDLMALVSENFENATGPERP